MNMTIFKLKHFQNQKELITGPPYEGILSVLAILKIKNPHLKVGISVGGWTGSGYFSGVSKDKNKRHNFATNIVKFIDYLGYDFVDIDWEYSTAERKGDSAGNGVQIDEGCPGSDDNDKDSSSDSSFDDAEELEKENEVNYQGKLYKFVKDKYLKNYGLN